LNRRRRFGQDRLDELFSRRFAMRHPDLVERRG
jgi:hypothetical protein